VEWGSRSGAAAEVLKTKRKIKMLDPHPTSSKQILYKKTTSSEGEVNPQKVYAALTTMY